MKTLLKIYSVSIVVVLGFFSFFLIPWGLLPFSDGVNLIVVGGVILGVAVLIIVRVARKEGFEFGWFLANRGGLWVIAAGLIGLLVLGCGALLTVSPQLFVPAFEQGALPFGIMLVSLFWLALIHLFAYPAVGLIATTVAHIRLMQLSQAATHALVALVCLALASLFFLLFVEVINDIAFRISVETQWKAIWVFAGGLVVAGTVQGFRGAASDHMNGDSTEAERM